MKYENFFLSHYIQHILKCEYAGHPRSGRCELNIGVVQQVLFHRVLQSQPDSAVLKQGFPRKQCGISWNIANLLAFSNEATFHTSGFVNRHNTIFWGTEKPRVIREHEGDFLKVNIWCALTAAGVIGPYFFWYPNRDFKHVLNDVGSSTPLMNHLYKSDVQGIFNKTVHHHIMHLLLVPILITHFLIDGLVMQDHWPGLHNTQTWHLVISGCGVW